MLGGYSVSEANGDKSQASQGSSDYWIVKVDGSGNKIWDKRFGGMSEEYIFSMIATADGGFLLGGSSSSGANGDKSQVSQGNTDYWVVKIDGSGNKVWDKRFGGTNSDGMNSMIPTADGGYLLGGYSVSEANGDKSQASQGLGDFWVVKISGAACTLTASIAPSTFQSTCSGSIISLSGSSTGGTSPTYTWSSSPSGFSSTQQNPSFTTPTVTSLTNYTITLTVTDGACTATATKLLRVNPTPTVNTISNQTVSVGITTSAINFGGSVANATYSWTNSNTSIGLAASGTGDIPAFTTVNTGTTAQIANVSVTPITYGYAYIANATSNTVSLINTTTNAVVKTINVGSKPTGVVVSPDESRVYVTNAVSNSVSVINTATNAVTAIISVGAFPEGLCVSPDGSRLYVTNTTDNTISVINTSTNTVLSTFSAGNTSEMIIISPDGSRLYLANTGSNTVSVINTATNAIVSTISVGSIPEGLAISPDGTKLYVANYSSNSVSVINTTNNALIASIAVGTQPITITVNRDGSKLYVVNRGANTVSVISTSNYSVVNIITLAAGSIPNGASLNTDETNLYVANYGFNNVSVINTATNAISSIISVGTNPISWGNFTSGFNCSGIAKTFTITVNPPGPTTITQMEYFIDNDPGYGSGTAVSVTSGNPVTVNFPVSLSSSTDGFHFLNLRAKDSKNNWGIAGIRPFYKETIPSNTLTNLNQIEYFIDSDPGYGLATAISFPPRSSESLVFTVLMANGLADGFHFLSVRAKDVNNNWSIVGVRPFYKETLPNNTLPNITQMEYFIDNDTGYGNGTPITGFTQNTSVNNSFTINLGSLTNGTHKLIIRGKDANNKWGIVGIKEFVVQDNIVIIGNIPTSWCKTTTFNIPYTVSGTYTAGNVFTAQLSDAAGSFSSPTTLGTITSTTSGTIVGSIPNTVVVGNGYLIRVISSTPSITNSPAKTIDITALCQCLLNASVATGNWGTAGIWSCGHIPLATESVQISSGHTVTLDVNGVAKSLDLRGILNQQATKVLTIQGN